MGSRREGEAMMLSNRDILNLLRAKPGRFIEDIAGDELPMREGDDSYVVVFENGRDYRVTATVEQMRDLEKEGWVVTQPGRWVWRARLEAQPVLNLVGPTRDRRN
jgi:hypothetical protein